MANINKFISLGAENLKLWGMFWINVAYNSALINFFVKHIEFGLPFDTSALIDLLGDSLRLQTKKKCDTVVKKYFACFSDWRGAGARHL